MVPPFFKVKLTITSNGGVLNIDSGLQVGDSPTFCGLTIQGMLFKEN